MGYLGFRYGFMSTYETIFLETVSGAYNILMFTMDHCACLSLVMALVGIHTKWLLYQVYL